MEREEVVKVAKENLEEGERWHKKVNVREIVFGFNDGSISTLALLAGVTGGALVFLLVSTPQTSLLASSIITFASLFTIGVWKTTFTNKHWLVSGIEMVFVGILAAAIPYAIGELFLPTILSIILG